MTTSIASRSPKPAQTHRPPPAKFDDLPDDALVRQSTVQVLYAITGSSLWRYIAAGRVPAPVLSRQRGDGMTAWRVGDLRAHLRALAQRRGVHT